MTPDDYCADLHQQVQLEAGIEGLERSLPQAFTEMLAAQLSELGEVEDAEVAHYEARGARASGFSVRGDLEGLDVLVTAYRGGYPAEVLPKAEVDAAFKRARTFVERCRDGLHLTLEESSAAYDMAARIHDVLLKATEVRLFLLTDSIVRASPPDLEPFGDVAITTHVWDFDRLYKLASSGAEREPITVDLEQFNGGPLPCLGPRGSDGDYEAYLLIVPGTVLASVYAEFGPRLLELNVRSFLQARGKVNRGIQDTLGSEPDRFFAYNNGISMTAAGVDLVRTDDGGQGIIAIHDLQIVNGGQTTASLYHAMVKNKLDLSAVDVQAKLSVVEPTKLNEIVPRISEFANSQNKVNTADFSANHPFHVKLEELSRTVWAPAADGSQNLTRWFFERARGQYADALARERTPARQRQFKLAHPASQKFTKTDLAKFENTWDQLPNLVALGAEKNFREFMLRLKERGEFQPDQQYFERLIAKTLLFRTAEKAIGSLQLGGYRAQTVTYTLALISHRTGQRLDLDGIWRRQSLPDPVKNAITELAPDVHSVLLNAPNKGNVGEWAKKPACWKAVQEIKWTPDAALTELLVAKGHGTTSRGETSVAELLNPSEVEAMEAVAKVPADAWFQLSTWARQTGNLQPWQRGLAFSLGQLAGRDAKPSRKQAVQGAKIYAEASRLGFAATELLDD